MVLTRDGAWAEWPGLIFASERGRARVLTFMDRVRSMAIHWANSTKLCEEQLNTIQSSLDRLAEALKESEA